MNDEFAIISTVDFITPPVDDPYWFGQIAAANSISDIYSMGGRPLTALNLVMFPAKHLDMGVLKEILRGGHDTVTEAGACLVGGHSVDDDEPKYGLSVHGSVHPDRVITNAGSRPGDALILTKPVGTGVLFNAVRDGKMSFQELEREVLPAVAALNARAMETALDFDLHACTDITGFGIAGHLFEVAQGSDSTIRLEFSRLPVYSGAVEMYRQGVGTGSNLPNRLMVQEHLEIEATLSKAEEQLLFDPQTSGGLLLSIPESQADELLSSLLAVGETSAVRVGEVVDGPPALVVV
jgi:selenide,water dikinase